MGKQYRYLMNNEVVGSDIPYPLMADFPANEFGRNDWNDAKRLWHNSLVKLKCSEVELDKIKKQLSSIKLRWDEVIDTTSITTVKCETMLLSNPPKPVYKVYFKEVESESKTWDDIYIEYMNDVPNWREEGCEPLPSWLKSNYQIPNKL